MDKDNNTSKVYEVVSQEITLKNTQTGECKHAQKSMYFLHVFQDTASLYPVHYLLEELLTIKKTQRVIGGLENQFLSN